MSETPSTQVSTFKCGHCGYDLRATGIGSPCPECGTLVQSEADAHAPFDHASYRIVVGYGWRLPLMTFVAIIVAPIGCILLTNLVPRISAFAFSCSLIGITFSLLLAPRWKERVAIHHRLQAGDPVCRLVRWGALVWVGLSLVVYFQWASSLNDMLLMLMLIPTSLHTMLMFLIVERIARWMSVDGVVQCARFVQGACVVLAAIWFLSIIAQLIFIGVTSGAPSLIGQLLRVLVLFVMGGVVISWISLLWLAKSAVFNILHYHENLGIEQRRLDRMREERRRHASRP
ncbi:MAG: hypothetical protein VX641_00575 [Planctomycetota bacterium]|nr:hypothetical protein [Planctomycetota bacterium]